MRLRYKIGLVVVVISLAVCLMTYQSYALWVKDMVAEQDNVVEVGCFSIEFVDNSSKINLQNTYPVSDEKGLKGTPYTFTITNTCTIDDSYIVTLNTLKSAIVPEGNVVIGKNKDDTEIKEHYTAYNMKEKVKFALAEGESNENNDLKSGTLLSEHIKEGANVNTDTTELNIEDLETSIILTSGTLKGKTGDSEKGESKTYHLYLWFDEKAGNEIMGKSFTASVDIIHHASFAKDEQGDEPQGEDSPLPNDVLDNVIRDSEEDLGGGQPDSEGNGLYEVSHTDGPEGWTEPELRYAGPDPDNYVTFNEELWRIIGLVNVKVDKENGENAIEQRIKIIKADSIGNYSWDHKSSGTGSSISSYGSNDWTDSQLMEMLNGIYYNSQNGDCWTGSSGSSSSKSTCNFTQSNSGVKGLKESARDMTDKDIIWNLGGSSTYNNVTVSQFYERERGTSVYTSSDLPFARETEWQSSNTAKASLETTSEKKLDSSLFRSIALPYPSDYGYATSGGSKGRAACLAKEIYNWKSDYIDCGNNDWLKPASGYMWTLSPYSSNSVNVFHVYSVGYVFDARAFTSRGVWPALYLSSKWKISNGTGESESPPGSKENPFIITAK